METRFGRSLADLARFPMGRSVLTATAALAAAGVCFRHSGLLKTLVSVPPGRGNIRFV
jgi:hypothetical protein